jgi:hypothetical protein
MSHNLRLDSTLINSDGASALAGSHYLSSIVDLNDLTSLTLPPLNPYFYASEVKTMLPLIGSFEHNNPQVHLALNRLNNTCRLGLCDLEINALSKMLSVLAVNPRFGADFSIEAAFGENPTAHSFHSVLLVQEAFRRADLLGDADMLPVRLGMSNGLLMHDLPEILKELSSLVQRAIHNVDEVPAIEAQILLPFLKLALYTSENENFAGEFFRLTYNEREKLNVGVETLSNLGGLLEQLKKFETEELSKMYLNPGGSRAFERLSKFYFIIELSSKVEPEILKKLNLSQDFSEIERFIGCAGSILEHIQGTRHLLRFGTKTENFERLQVFETPSLPSREESLIKKVMDGGLTTLPLSISPSYRIRRNIDYQENGIGEMFDCVKNIPNNSKFLKLAKHIRNMAYETIIELTSCYPVVFDLRAKKIPDFVTERMKKVRSGELSLAERKHTLGEVIEFLKSETRKNVGRFKDQMRNTSCEDRQSKMFPLESEERVTSLYQAAMDRDYIPRAGEFLLFRDTVPDALRPLKLVRWHEKLGGKMNISNRASSRKVS